MTTQAVSTRESYLRLVAPIVLVLFVVGWYQFSLVYIQGADNQLVAGGNLGVYVPVQQVQGYLDALLYATYVGAALGLVVFFYNLAKVLGTRSRRGLAKHAQG